MKLSRRNFLAALGVTGVATMAPAIALAGPDYARESIQAAMGISPLPAVKSDIFALTEIVARLTEFTLGNVKCASLCEIKGAKIGYSFTYHQHQWPDSIRRQGNLVNVATASWEGEPTEYYIQKSAEGIAEEIKFHAAHGFVCGKLNITEIPLLDSSCNHTTSGGLTVRGLKLYDSRYNQHHYRFDVLYGAA